MDTCNTLVNLLIEGMPVRVGIPATARAPATAGRQVRAAGSRNTSNTRDTIIIRDVSYRKGPYSENFVFLSEKKQISVL